MHVALLEITLTTSLKKDYIIKINISILNSVSKIPI